MLPVASADMEEGEIVEAAVEVDATLATMDGVGVSPVETVKGKSIDSKKPIDSSTVSNVPPTAQGNPVMAMDRIIMDKTEGNDESTLAMESEGRVSPSPSPSDNASATPSAKHTLLAAVRSALHGALHNDDRACTETISTGVSEAAGGTSPAVMNALVERLATVEQQLATARAGIDQLVDSRVRAVIAEWMMDNDGQACESRNSQVASEGHNDAPDVTSTTLDGQAETTTNADAAIQFLAELGDFDSGHVSEESELGDHSSRGKFITIDNEDPLLRYIDSATWKLIREGGYVNLATPSFLQPFGDSFNGSLKSSSHQVHCYADWSFAFHRFLLATAQIAPHRMGYWLRYGAFIAELAQRKQWEPIQCADVSWRMRLKVEMVDAIVENGSSWRQPDDRWFRELTQTSRHDLEKSSIIASAAAAPSAIAGKTMPVSTPVNTNTVKGIPGELHFDDEDDDEVDIAVPQAFEPKRREPSVDRDDRESKRPRTNSIAPSSTQRRSPVSTDSVAKKFPATTSYVSKNKTLAMSYDKHLPSHAIHYKGKFLQVCHYWNSGYCYRSDDTCIRHHVCPWCVKDTCRGGRECGGGEERKRGSSIDYKSSSSVDRKSSSAVDRQSKDTHLWHADQRESDKRLSIAERVRFPSRERNEVYYSRVRKDDVRKDGASSSSLSPSSSNYKGRYADYRVENNRDGKYHGEKNYSR